MDFWGCIVSHLKSWYRSNWFLLTEFDSTCSWMSVVHYTSEILKTKYFFCFTFIFNIMYLFFIQLDCRSIWWIKLYVVKAESTKWISDPLWTLFFIGFRVGHTKIWREGVKCLLVFVVLSCVNQKQRFIGKRTVFWARIGFSLRALSRE